MGKDQFSACASNQLGGLFERDRHLGDVAFYQVVIKGRLPVRDNTLFHHVVGNVGPAKRSVNGFLYCLQILVGKQFQVVSGQFLVDLFKNLFRPFPPEISQHIKGYRF